MGWKMFDIQGPLQRSDSMSGYVLSIAASGGTMPVFLGPIHVEVNTR